MRIAAATLAILSILAVAPADAADDDLPAGVEQLLTCGHVYSLRSDDARAEGDEGAATEFFHMGDTLLWQARTVLEAAGYSAEQIDNIDMNRALTTGFNYGAGMGAEMLADCIADWDSP